MSLFTSSNSHFFTIKFNLCLFNVEHFQTFKKKNHYWNALLHSEDHPAVEWLYQHKLYVSYFCEFLDLLCSDLSSHKDDMKFFYSFCSRKKFVHVTMRFTWFLFKTLLASSASFKILSTMSSSDTLLSLPLASAFAASIFSAPRWNRLHCEGPGTRTWWWRWVEWVVEEIH